MSETINIDQLTPAQEKALLEKLKAKQSKAQAAKEKTRVKYEKARDKNIQSTVKIAQGLSLKLEAFKVAVSEMMEAQHIALDGYGELRGNSKGGFSIVTTEGDMKVVRTRDTMPQWDERGEKGVALLHDFLYDTVKKADQKMFKVLMRFLARNEKGDLEYSRVMELLKERDVYDDPRWVEGIQLIEESYQVHMRGYGYEFFIKDPEGKWSRISLNFTSL